MEELTNSLKAKLYDSFSTSFMASFILSSILINHKYVLIYFSNYNDLNKKLSLLDHYYLGIEKIILLPLLIALIYTILFPYFHHFILKVSENHKNKSKNIKLEAHNQKPISENEKKDLLDEIYRLKETLDEKNEFVSKLEINSKKEVKEKDDLISQRNTTIESYILEVKELKETISNLSDIENEKNELNTKLTQSEKSLLTLKNNLSITSDKYNLLKEENTEYNKNYITLGERNQELSDQNTELNIEVSQLTDTIKELEKKISEYTLELSKKKDLHNQIEKLTYDNQRLNSLISIHSIDVKFNNIDNLSDIEISILKVLGTKNYISESNYYEDFITKIANWLEIPRIVSEELIPKLINKGYLSITNNNLKKVLITSKGRETIIKLIHS